MSKRTTPPLQDLPQATMSRRTTPPPQDLLPKVHTRVLKNITSTEDLIQVNSVFMGRFDVFAKLGGGSHGEVYAAYDRETAEDVAVKALKTQILFSEETDALKQFSGMIHFCRYITHDLKAEIPFIIMELKGPALTEIVEQYGPLSQTTSANIALQLLDAIETMHKNGYLHNDVKLSNVVVGVPPHTLSIISIVDFSRARKCTTVQQSTLKNQDAQLTTNTVGIVSPSRSKRNDVVGLLFLLVELRGRVPWETARAQRDLLSVQSIKEETLEGLLSERFGADFVNLKKYIYSINASQTPDYVKMNHYIHNFVTSEGLKLENKVEWEENPHKIWKVVSVRDTLKIEADKPSFPSIHLSDQAAGSSAQDKSPRAGGSSKDTRIPSGSVIKDYVGVITARSLDPYITEDGSFKKLHNLPSVDDERPKEEDVQQLEAKESSLPVDMSTSGKQSGLFKSECSRPDDKVGTSGRNQSDSTSPSIAPGSSGVVRSSKCKEKKSDSSPPVTRSKSKEKLDEKKKQTGKGAI